MAKPVSDSPAFSLRAVQGGSSIAFWWERILSSQLEVDGYDIILIHLGVIDILRAIASSENVLPLHIVPRLGSLIEAIRIFNSHAYIVVSAVIPVVDRKLWYQGVEPMRRAVNTGFARLCAQFHNVAFFKTFDRFLKFNHPVIDYFQEDGLHLSQAGADILLPWFHQIISIPTIVEQLNSNERARLGKLIATDIVLDNTIYKSPRFLACLY